jgi:hypothetical protein
MPVLAGLPFHEEHLVWASANEFGMDVTIRRFMIILRRFHTWGKSWLSFGSMRSVILRVSKPLRTRGWFADLRVERVFGNCGFIP